MLTLESLPAGTVFVGNRMRVPKRAGYRVAVFTPEVRPLAIEEAAAPVTVTDENGSTVDLRAYATTQALTAAVENLHNADLTQQQRIADLVAALAPLQADPVTKTYVDNLVQSIRNIDADQATAIQQLQTLLAQDDNLLQSLLATQAQHTSQLAALQSGKQDKFVLAARRTWYVEAGGQGSTGAGSAYAPFATMTQAMGVASNGDTIVYRSAGTYNATTKRFENNEAFQVTRSVSLVFNPGVVMTGEILLGQFPQSGQALVLAVHGLNIGARCVVVRQRSTAGAHPNIEFFDCYISAGGYLEHFGISTDYATPDQIVLHNLRVNTLGNSRPVLLSNEAGGYGQGGVFQLEGGHLQPGGNLLGQLQGYGAGSRAFISPATVIELVSGAALSEDLTRVVDNRPATPSPAASPAASYTGTGNIKITGSVISDQLPVVPSELYGHALALNADLSGTLNWIDAALAILPIPEAPVAGTLDSAFRLFYFTVNEDYGYARHEYTTDGGATWQQRKTYNQFFFLPTTAIGSQQYGIRVAGKANSNKPGVICWCPPLAAGDYTATNQPNVAAKASFDDATNGQLGGWVFDQNNLQAIVAFDIYIDNVFWRPMPANGLRNDVATAFHCQPYVGFSFLLPSQFRDGQNHNINLLTRGTGALMGAKTTQLNPL